MKTISKKSKKLFLIALALVLLILFFSQTAIGKRLNLPAGLVEAVKTFFAGNPELHGCDYKDGTIILIKPVKTGTGDGAYEAGDIVEIRDGTALCERFGNGDPLGKMEKTNLLPVYYPGKLSEEQKRELTEPEYTPDVIPARSAEAPARRAEAGIQTPSVIPASEPESRNESGSRVTRPNARQNDSVGLASGGREPGMTNGEKNVKMLLRRKQGIDYTKFLSDSEVLKVRSFESLDKIPEIDLSSVIDKKSGLSFNQNSASNLSLSDSDKIPSLSDSKTLNSPNKKSAGLAENQEAAGQRLSLNKPDFVSVNNSQFAGNTDFFDTDKKIQSHINHFVFGEVFNQKNNNAAAFGNIETENIAKAPVKSEQSAFGFDGKVKNFFIAGAGKARFFNRDNVKTPFFDGQKEISVNTFVSEDFWHRAAKLVSALQFKNFLFGESSGRVAQSRSDVLGGDFGVLFGNFFNGIAGLNEVQNVGNGDSGSLNAGFAKSDHLLNDNASALVGFGGSFSHINNYSLNKDNVNTRVSVVQLSDRLAKLENFRNSVKKIVRTIIPFAYAGTGGTKTIYTSGCDYTTLSGWEAAMQRLILS